jgi:uncharacterized protein (TIGR02147 family)
MPDIYDYTDYRTFLKDWFEAAKQKQSFLSFRYLGRKTGVDAGYLVRVLQGSKHLADTSLEEVANITGLSEQQKRYFFELVLFNKAKGEHEINDRYKRLLALRESNARVLDSREFRYFSKWFYPAVRLSLFNNDFLGDYQDLAQRITPEITVEEAQEAIRVLAELELIRESAPAQWEVSDNHLSTGDAWSSLAVREFQRTMLKMAADALHIHPKENREIATLSLAIPREEISTLQEMMSDFRKQVAKWALSLNDSDCVMQFNLSCFPLSMPELTVLNSAEDQLGGLEPKDQEASDPYEDPSLGAEK